VLVLQKEFVWANNESYELVDEFEANENDAGDRGGSRQNVAGAQFETVDC
jgi:hypothetical protein